MLDLITVIRECDDRIRQLGSAQAMHLAAQVLAAQFDGSEVAETSPKSVSGESSTPTPPSPSQPPQTDKLVRILRRLKEMSDRTNNLTTLVSSLLDDRSETQEKIETIKRRLAQVMVQQEGIQRSCSQTAMSIKALEDWHGRIQLSSEGYVRTDCSRVTAKAPIPPLSPSPPAMRSPIDAARWAGTSLPTRPSREPAANQFVPDANQLQAILLDLIRDKGEITVKDAIERTGMTYMTMYHALTKLYGQKLCLREKKESGMLVYAPIQDPPQQATGALTLRDKILAIMKKEAPRSVKILELATQTGASYNTVSGRLVDLMNRGLCIRPQAGQYTVTAAGAAG